MDASWASPNEVPETPDCEFLYRDRWLWRFDTLVHQSNICCMALCNTSKDDVCKNNPSQSFSFHISISSSHFPSQEQNYRFGWLGEVIQYTKGCNLSQNSLLHIVIVFSPSHENAYCGKERWELFCSFKHLILNMQK